MKSSRIVYIMFLSRGHEVEDGNEEGINLFVLNKNSHTFAVNSHQKCKKPHTSLKAFGETRPCSFSFQEFMPSMLFFDRTLI